ncbi:MAG: MATE family efflux transporter [Gammaproteobacteria bacterium]|nr:MATE family efflux transporter [Gammaproteobacteria bacterium]
MQKNYLRTILAIAMPMMLTQIINSLSGFLGNIMLAHLGHDVLAASALLSSTQMMVTLVFMSLLFSMGVMVSRANGRGDTTEIGNLVQQGWLLGLLLSIGAILIYWFIEPILILFGQDPHLAHLVVPYFHWALIGMPILMINIPSSQLCFATGKQIMMANIMLVQAVVITISSYVLIFGKLGLPALGIEGLGIAFDIAMITQFILVWSCFASLHNFKKYHLFKTHLRNNWIHLKQLFVIGWPISVQVSSELTAYSFITYMIGWLGVIPLAAGQIVNQFMLLLLIPSFGFSSAAAMLIGRAVGAKDYADVKTAADWNMLLSLGIVVILGIPLIIFTVPLTHLFITATQPHYLAILALLKPVIIIGVLGIFFDTIRNTLTGVLRGLYDTRITMIVAILSLWIIRMPLAYLFGFVWHGGIIGIAWSGVIGVAIGAGLLWLRWQKKLRTFIN